MFSIKLSVHEDKKIVIVIKGMNGDQKTTRNNAFSNIPKKNHVHKE